MSNAPWSSLLWFALVVIAIPFVLVLLKRSPLGGGAAASAASMRVVGALAVSPNQRVVTIEVGQGADQRWLVLGVTAQTITTLHTMPPQPGPAPAAPDAQPFAQVLRLWSRPEDRPHAR